MDDMGCSGHRFADCGCVEDVAANRAEVRVLGEGPRGKRVALEGVEDRDFVVFEEQTGEGRPNESSAARDKNVFVLEHDQ